jgi:hypothetical protein
MSPVNQPPTYTAYLLRCWREGSSFRYSLEEIGGGKRRGFASLDEFVAFLLARSEQQVEPQKPQAGSKALEPRSKVNWET